MSTSTIAVQLKTRREFCVQACQAASLLAASAMAACSSGPTSPSTNAPALTTIPASTAGNVVSVPIDPASVLGSVGGAALVTSSRGSFLVARTGTDTFTALTAICTHQQCTVTGFANDRYVCPCHGSQYTTAGAVANGPASSPLHQYATQFSGGVLTFTA